ncbi:uncharacterized protein [Palaemon carinicauda]|uniref:uncharacterized protein n=1 Tax=Palaemon carinicauda TaxID=392227 RepID=UPI0035B68F70
MSGEEESCHHLIQEEHVKRTLKADKGDCGELLEWSVEDFTKKGDNFASLIARVKVSYLMKEEQCSTSYVVKFRYDRSPDLVKNLFKAFFIKEVGFYEHIAPLLNAELRSVGKEALHIPKFYCSILDEEFGLMFIEDLHPRGFKMNDKLVGMDLSHTTLVFEELARLHAASTLLQGKKSLQELTDEFEFLKFDFHKYPGPSKENFKKSFESCFPTVNEILRRKGGYEKAQEWLCSNESALEDILERNLVLEEPFAVICHGDCWNNNMLFRYNDKGIPVEVMMIDLQVSRAASLATDLRYLTGLNLHPEVMKPSNLNDLLASYHKSFNAVMKCDGRSVPFSLQQLKEEYKKRYEWGLFFLMLPFSYIVKPSEYPEGSTKSLAMTVDENINKVDKMYPKFIDKIIHSFSEIVEERFI